MKRSELVLALTAALVSAQSAAGMLDSQFGTNYLGQLDLTLDNENGATVPADASKSAYTNGMMLLDSRLGTVSLEGIEKVRVEAIAAGDIEFSQTLPLAWHCQDASRTFLMTPEAAFNSRTNCDNARFRLLTAGMDPRRSAWFAQELTRDPTGQSMWLEGEKTEGAASLAGDLVLPNGTVRWSGLRASDSESWARAAWAWFKQSGRKPVVGS